VGSDTPSRRIFVSTTLVVTANKLVVATHGQRLWTMAAQHGAGLWFEASVGAGLPIITVLRDSLRGDRVTQVDGVINGTTNVVLTKMRRDGVSLPTALLDAQDRGFAEADPSADIDGWDAAQKLVIMSWLAFGSLVAVDDVDRVGIGSVDRADLAYTGQLGYTVKLLTHAHIDDAGRVHLRVRPTAIPGGHALYDVDDSENAVIVRSDLAGHVLVRGLGAGGPSTASAVVSDIVNAVRRRGAQPAPPSPRDAVLIGDDDVEVAGYIRLRVVDAPEAKELVVQALEDRGVPVLDTVDKPPIDGPLPQLLLLTGAAPRSVLDRALETLDSLAVVSEIACAMDRIEAA
jgi:homoserine dehydrogenase